MKSTCFTLTRILILVLFVLIQCLTGIVTSFEDQVTNYTLSLKFYLRVEISAEGSYVKEVLGDLADLESVKLEFRYSAHVNVVLSEDLEVENCNLTITFEGITTTPSSGVLNQIVADSGSIECVNVRKEDQYQRILALPLLVKLYRGNITLIEIPEDIELRGIARLDIDLVMSKEEIIIEQNGLINYTRKHLYYEPLTGIVVYYFEFTKLQDSYESGIYEYMAFAELENYAEKLSNYVKGFRKTFVVLENPTAELTLLIIHPAGSNEPEVSVVNATNTTITISFNNTTRCFLQLGRIPPQLGIEVSGISESELKRYMSGEGIIIYTPLPVTCSQINISLSVPVRDEPVNEFPEKCLPPRRQRPAITDIAISISLVYFAILLSYVIINKLVNYFTRKK